MKKYQISPSKELVIGIRKNMPYEDIYSKNGDRFVKNSGMKNI